jgi:hypothetical protein
MYIVHPCSRSYTEEIPGQIRLIQDDGVGKIYVYACDALVGKPEMKRLLGIPRRRCSGNRVR